MAYGPPFYGIRTPPFMPYEPFLLGVGVVFNLLKFPLSHSLCRISRKAHLEPLLSAGLGMLSKLYIKHYKEIVLPQKIGGSIPSNGRGGFESQTSADSPPSNRRKTPKKQTVGTVTASPNMLTLQALSSSLNAGAAKRGCLGREKAFG